MKILVCTDGTGASEQSAELIPQLGFPAGTQVTILGVSESLLHEEHLIASLEKIASKLDNFFDISSKIRSGIPVVEILAEAYENAYDLVVIGGGGNQMSILNPKLGSTTGNLVRKLHTHFLVARNIPEKLGKILVCTGAEPPTGETMRLGGEWISNTDAQIGLLHVTPLNIDNPASENIDQEQVSSPTEPKSPQEVILERANQQLRKAGVKSEIITRIRLGMVVDQVLQELSEGDYDLLVVGAHYQPGQDRWQGTLFDDVTDQLLNRSSCSVLII
jgi:nucleotide-binding universal stress UspA family protein